MSKLMAFWRGHIDRNVMVVAVLIVWGVTAGFNAVMGWETAGDSGIKGVLYAACFVGLAALGAYGFAQYSFERGALRAALLTIGCVQLLVGQVAGWQSLGLTLAKGAASLEDKASSRRSATDALKAARDELEKIGIKRPIGEIEADERLECRRTSAQYKDGVGPACTRLRGELAAATRAKELTDNIGPLTAAVGAAPKIKNADATYEVPMAFAAGLGELWTGKRPKVSSDDVRFWWLVFLVATLELVGTLGFWVLGVHGDPAKAHRRDDDAGGGSSGGLSGGSGADLFGSSLAYAGLPQQHAPLRRFVHRQLPTPPAWPPSRMSDQAAAASPSSGSANALHGAPITIHFGGALQGQPVPANTDTPRVAAADAEIVEPPARAPRHDVGVVDGAPPVDRSAISALTDNLLAFSAACVVTVSGGHVTADDLYRRYCAWRGSGAIGAAAFHTLFPEVASIDTLDVGGQRHYRGIALRAPLLSAVG